MHDRLQTARSIDEVIQIHDFFLQKCLKECLLLLPELLVKVEKLKALCLQYATSIQLLIPSIEVANPENTSKSGKSRARINKSQDRPATETSIRECCDVRVDLEIRSSIQFGAPKPCVDTEQQLTGGTIPGSSCAVHPWNANRSVIIRCVPCLAEIQCAPT
uniref:Gamma-tubulin complex component n=1 Tax=Arundo donax TaxID=35708 RepID=A0A0A9GN04_ARUDO